MKHVGGGVCVYIDAANLEKGAAAQNIDIDYQKFFVWLQEKYGACHVYFFVGFLPKFQWRYEFLRQAGFALVFKEVVFSGGKPKGNCDADLIVRAMRDYFEGTCKKAILISSDGDYAPLVKFLSEHDTFQTIISPAEPAKCSILLKRLNVSITFLYRMAPHFLL